MRYGTETNALNCELTGQRSQWNNIWWKQHFWAEAYSAAVELKFSNLSTYFTCSKYMCCITIIIAIAISAGGPKSRIPFVTYTSPPPPFTLSCTIGLPIIMVSFKSPPGCSLSDVHCGTNQAYRVYSEMLPAFSLSSLSRNVQTLVAPGRHWEAVTHPTIKGLIVHSC